MTVHVAPLSEGRLDRLDRFLQATVADTVRNDQRLRGLGVRAEFRGGVAHLTGTVRHEEQVSLVRELVGRLAGVLAVWDRVQVGGRRPVVLDLGCGAAKQYADNIGVDIRPAKGVDVVADLSRGIPFEDSSVDRVFAVHVLEHLVDYLPLLEECHRVLRPGGILHVMSPWWRHVNAVADPTHVRLLDVQTIKQICVASSGNRPWYPLHVGCDGASVFADLMPLDDSVLDIAPEHLARFFD